MKKQRQFPQPSPRQMTRRLLISAAIAAPIMAPAISRAQENALERAVSAACREAVVQKKGFFPAPGASAAVIAPNGRPITAVYGLADPDAGLSVAPTTRFMSGSTGKTFCAAGIMALVDAGRLHLDQKAASIFPGENWYENLPNANDLTIRHLLSHRGGFQQFLALPSFQATYALDALTGGERAYTPKRMLRFLENARPLFKAGEGYWYSDLHYHLLGLVIEKISGMSYYAFLSRAVIDKMQMFAADTVPANTQAIDRLAAGYAKGGLTGRIAGVNGRSTDANGALRNDPSLEYAGGGLATTPRALAEFYWRLARGEIISPGAFQQMCAPSDGSETRGADSGSGYRLGFYLTTRDGFGRYISHSGFYPGYTSNVAHFLDHGFSVAIQQNTDHGADLFQRTRDIAAATIEALGR